MLVHEKFTILCMNKICTKCKNNEVNSGSWCRQCRSKSEALKRIKAGCTPLRKRNPDHLKNGLKECFKCDGIIELDAFSVLKRGYAGRSAWCKECCKRYANNNRKNINEYLRNNYRKTERYKMSHRHETHKRRAITKRSDVDTDFLINLYSTCECFYCGSVVVGKDKTADHVVPLSDDGEHKRNNLVMSCGNCNYTKGNRPLSYLTDKLPTERKEIVEKKIWLMKQK